MKPNKIFRYVRLLTPHKMHSTFNDEHAISTMNSKLKIEYFLLDSVFQVLAQKGWVGCRCHDITFLSVMNIMINDKTNVTSDNFFLLKSSVSVAYVFVKVCMRLPYHKYKFLANFLPSFLNQHSIHLTCFTNCDLITRNLSSKPSPFIATS